MPVRGSSRRTNLREASAACVLQHGYSGESGESGLGGSDCKARVEPSIHGGLER